MRTFRFDKVAFAPGSSPAAPVPPKTPSMTGALMPPGMNRLVTKSPAAAQEQAMLDQVEEQAGDMGNPVLDDANAMAAGMPLPSESPEGYQANLEADDAQAEAAALQDEAAAGADPAAAAPAPAGGGPVRKTVIEKKTVIEPAGLPQTTESSSTGPGGETPAKKPALKSEGAEKKAAARAMARAAGYSTGVREDGCAANDAMAELGVEGGVKGPVGHSFPVATEYQSEKNASSSDVTKGELLRELVKHERRETPAQEAQETEDEQDIERRAGIHEGAEKKAFARALRRGLRRG